VVAGALLATPLLATATLAQVSGPSENDHAQGAKAHSQLVGPFNGSQKGAYGW